nr:uncharacterized protein LOC117274708 [Nicotiana tomentosiformis]
MGLSAAELPSPLSLIAIFAFIIVYLTLVARAYLLNSCKKSVVSISKDKQIRCVPFAWVVFVKQNCAEVFQLVTMYFMLNVLILGWRKDQFVQHVEHHSGHSFHCQSKKPLKCTSTLGRGIKAFTTTTVTTFTNMNRYQNVEPGDMKMSSILLYVYTF